MIWIQKALTALWTVLVLLYTTRTEWIVLFVILLFVEVFVTLQYKPRECWGLLPRALAGYVLAVIIFVGFANAFLPWESVQLVVMGSITVAQIDSITTKLGEQSVAFTLWVQIKRRWQRLLEERVQRVDDNLPQGQGGGRPDADPPH